MLITEAQVYIQPTRRQLDRLVVQAQQVQQAAQQFVTVDDQVIVDNQHVEPVTNNSEYLRVDSYHIQQPDTIQGTLQAAEIVNGVVVEPVVAEAVQIAKVDPIILEPGFHGGYDKNVERSLGIGYPLPPGYGDYRSIVPPSRGHIPSNVNYLKLSRLEH